MPSMITVIHIVIFSVRALSSSTGPTQFSTFEVEVTTRTSLSAAVSFAVAIECLQKFFWSRGIISKFGPVFIPTQFESIF